jgi:hypothetical protein
MNTLRTHRSLAVAAAAAALVGLAAGCSSTKQEAPTTTPSSTSPTSTVESTQPSVAPTENQVTPSGANSFTPTHVQMPSPPTAGAGEHFN